MGQISFFPANNAGLIGASLRTDASPLFELQTGPTDYPLIWEITTTLITNSNGAAAYPLGLGIPAVKGVGVNPIGFSYDDGGNTGDVSQIQFYSEWTRPPTIPGTFIRRFTGAIAASSSNGWCPVLFRFLRGYKMAPSTSLVLWGFGGPANVSSTISVPNIIADA